MLSQVTVNLVVQQLERSFQLMYHLDMKSKVISYLRVSTSRQGSSGLGLEGQRAAVEQFCSENGAELVAEYQEVESGRKNDRPVLRQALARARATKATLLIAKLDRLARNVHFISGLMEAGCDFRACDIPHANRLTVHIMAAVAEDEARRISERTKAALAAYKARGGNLGAANPRCRHLNQELRKKGAIVSAKARITQAAEMNAEATVTALHLKGEGRSLREIAIELDKRGLPTRHGKPWSHVQVLRLIRRSA